MAGPPTPAIPNQAITTADQADRTQHSVPPGGLRGSRLISRVAAHGVEVGLAAYGGTRIDGVRPWCRSTRGA